MDITWAQRVPGIGNCYETKDKERDERDNVYKTFERVCDWFYDNNSVWSNATRFIPV